MIPRLALPILAIGLWSATAAAQVAPIAKTGDTLDLAPAAWQKDLSAKNTWTLGPPSTTDAAGKVVIHWFCTPKVSACVDDLARLVTLRENGGVYIVAYINGNAKDAKKLDPIRESEGVGRGTVASGPGVKKLFKTLGIAKGPQSVVVDVYGKVKAITTSGDINELDARDTVVKQLVEAVKPYTTSNEGPKGGNPTSKLTFTLRVALSPWNSFSDKAPREFTFAAAKEIKCDATTLKGDQIKIDGKNLTATVTCTAPKGIYQARGDLKFGYVGASGAQGLGAETATWKFEIKP
jgi:hypothetical protein